MVALGIPGDIVAAVILAYCSIGVFALGNSTDDLWALLVFGVVGYAMRVLRFPLAPMISGVLLGNLAKLNLSRAFASEMSQFVTSFGTRQGAFFVLLAGFSAGFSWYQKDRGKKKWLLVFISLMASVLANPMLFMEGFVRTGMAAALLGWGVARLGLNRRPYHSERNVLNIGSCDAHFSSHSRRPAVDRRFLRALLEQTALPCARRHRSNRDERVDRTR